MIDDKPRTEAPPAGQEAAPRFPPIAYPLLALAFGGVLVWSFSRILLAVTKDQAVLIAILMATNVLVGSALIAYGRRVRRRPASFPLVVASGLAVVGAGIAAFTFGDLAPGGPGEGEGRHPPITLTASGLRFLEPELRLPAGGEVTVQFRNDDQGVPHDFVLFDGPDAAAPELFDGPEVTGIASTEYSFTAPPPGSYFFHCSIHPTEMTGTATVAEGGGAPGGGPPGAVEVTARGTAFTPTEVSIPPGGEVIIRFVNEDANIPHNMSVFEGQDATGAPVFTGEVITGPAETEYMFVAPEPGSYFFRCDVHPVQMTGTITVG